jgi:CD109 antigen
MFSGQMRNEFQEQLSQNINDALDFLVDQQREDGSFNEPGKVSHKPMQGGVNSNMTMTAYVLITFRETVFANKNEKYTQAADKAQRYLEQRLADIDPQDVYTMSIVTYALNLVGSDFANEALRIFESMSTKNGRWKNVLAGTRGQIF